MLRHHLGANTCEVQAVVRGIGAQSKVALYVENLFKRACTFSFKFEQRGNGKLIPIFNDTRHENALFFSCIRTKRENV